jgi:probable HAF family extracellular repeat protein
MTPRCWSMSVTLAVFASLLLTTGRPAAGATLPAAPGYVLTDLGSLGGQTTATAINVRNQVAGASATAAGPIHAFVLQADGSMTDLGAMGGVASTATSLNNQGDVVGFSNTADGQVHPFAVIGGQMSDLGAGAAASKAVAVNDLRQVLLDAADSQGHTSTALWQNGQLMPLGTLGGSSAFGAALNNRGQVVGNATAADGTNHAFASDPSSPQLIDLGDIGVNGAMAHVNETGKAVGNRTAASGASIAFSADLQSMNLADEIVRRGFGGTVAYSINNEGTAVGAGNLSSGPGTNAGMWTADGAFTNLNTTLVANSGWVLQTATAINDAGVIVGTAMPPTGPLIAYRLITAGPELAADKATTLVQSIDPVVAAVQKSADAAANATPPAPLATALTDLQQAVTLLTPGAGQTPVTGVNTSQALHLLNSVTHLLQSVPGSSPFLAAADRDQAVATLAAAQTGLQ